MLDFSKEVLLPIRDKVEELESRLKPQSGKRTQQANLLAQIRVLKADEDKLRQEIGEVVGAVRDERNVALDEIIEKLGLKLDISVLARPIAYYKPDGNGIQFMEGEIVTTTTIRDNYGNRVFAREVTREVPEKKVFDMDLRETRRMEKRLTQKTDIHKFIANNVLKDGSLLWLVDKFYPNAQRKKLAKIESEIESDFDGASRSALEARREELEKICADYEKKLVKEKKLLKTLEERSGKDEKAMAKYKTELDILRVIEGEYDWAKKEMDKVEEGISLHYQKTKIEKQIKAMEKLMSTDELRDLINRFEDKQHALNEIKAQYKPKMDSADLIAKKIKTLQKESGDLSREIDEEEYLMEEKIAKQTNKLISSEVKKLVEGEFCEQHSEKEIRDAIASCRIDRRLEEVEEKIVDEFLEQFSHASSNDNELE